MMELNLDNTEMALLISLVVANARDIPDDDPFSDDSVKLLHAVIDAVRLSGVK